MEASPASISPEGSFPSEALATLIVAYLRGSSDTRQTLIDANPLLLTGETLPALEAAAAELAKTRAEASEVVRAIDELATAVDLPQEGTVATLRGEERRLLEDPEATVQQFTRTLTELLAGVVTADSGCRRHGHGDDVAAPAHQLRSTNGGEAGGSTEVALPWHQTASVTLAVLSYLSVEDVFLTAENVCRAWRYWLYQPEFSKYFWIEAVQREYPVELGKLIQMQGGDIMNSDWRTLAMVICAGEDEGEDCASNEEGGLPQ